jgi:hypothetical protein
VPSIVSLAGLDTEIESIELIETLLFGISRPVWRCR